MEREYLDCRETEGWLSDDLECQIDTEPWCDYHYHLLVQQAIRHTHEHEHGELRHVVVCVLFCVPICTTVCLIVERLLGG